MGKRRTVGCLLLVFVFCCALFPAHAVSASPLIVRSSVPAGAYAGDSSLSVVVVEEGAQSIGAGAFAGSSVTTVTLPSSLTLIADDAFDNTPLKYVHAEKGTYAYSWMRDHGFISEYRALVIGEHSYLWFFDNDDPDAGCWFDDEDQRNVSDVLHFSDMLLGVTGPHGAYGSAGQRFEITSEIDLSRTEIRDSIKTTFADTRDQDISVFFIATHGNHTNDGDLLTSFTGSIGDPDAIRDYWKNRYLPFSTLASWLSSNVKGRVFVVLESCGSGSAIYKKGIAENAVPAADSLRADTPENAERFVTRAAQAFSAADPGVSVPAAAVDGPLQGDTTGSLRLPKFYVLAASRHNEMSYGWETYEVETSFNFFTQWLLEGIGTADNSPADVNHDNYLSLAEMFDYVKQYDHFTEGGHTYYQHVQRYPKDNAYHLLKLELPDDFTYSVTDFRGETHAAGSGRSAVATVTRSTRNEVAYPYFEYVTVDGRALDPTDYRTARGGLVLAFTGAYLDTLDVGEHRVQFFFRDGTAEAVLTVTEEGPTPTPTETPTPTPTPTPAPTATPTPKPTARPVPRTGDGGDPALWIALLAAGPALLAGIWHPRRRRGNGKNRP